MGVGVYCPVLFIFTAPLFVIPNDTVLFSWRFPGVYIGGLDWVGWVVKRHHARVSSPDLRLKLQDNYFCTYQFLPIKSTRNRQTSLNPNVDKSLTPRLQYHPHALTLSLLYRSIASPTVDIITIPATNTRESPLG